MQHLGVNFGGIWRFELFSLYGFLFFLLRKSGLIFKSPVATLLPMWQCPHAAAGLYAACDECRVVVQCHYLSV